MKDTPAFPHTVEHLHEPVTTGMTLRQYAAIKLKVPDSGEDWLDAMIEESLRDDFAVTAMSAFLSNDGGTLAKDAEAAYMMAHEMMRARE